MLFGNRNTFAIEYRMLYEDELPEDWGCIYFWVNGRNLFAFKDCKPADTYHWYIYMFSRWLCESLKYIMTENDFVVQLDAFNSFEFLKEIDKKIETLEEDSQERYDLKCERYDWSENHCFFISRGGSFAPVMFIRSCSKKIEIVWESRATYDDEGVKFLYPEGFEHVSREDFFNATVAFLKQYCDLPEKQNWDSINELKQILQKTIETVVV